MPREVELQTLLAVLEERGIPLGADDVKWAFESSQTREAILSWVERYLHDETLLSFEEEALYRQLAPKWANKEPIPVQGSPLLEDEMVAAIEALEASTEAIERQCKNLETQKQALLAIKSQNRETSSRYRSAIEMGSKKNAQESGQLQVAVEELSHVVNSSTEAMRHQTTSALKSTHAVVQDTFEADDRVLSALAKVSSPEASTIDAAAAEQNLAALIALRSAAIRANIDYIYQRALLEALSQQRLPVPDQDLPSAIAELKTELGTLTAEIPSVIELGLNSTLRGPLSKALAESSRSQTASQGQTARYSMSSVEFMIKRLDETRTHIQFLLSIATSLDALASHVSGTAASDRQRSDSTASSKKAAAPGSHVTAAESLLTHLGVKAERADAVKTTREIAAALTIRSRKIAAQAGALDSSGLRMVAREVDREAEDLEKVLVEVWRGSDAEFGDLEDGDKKHPKRSDLLRKLEERVAAVGNAMRKAETEEGWEGKKADLLVEKWGDV